MSSLFTVRDETEQRSDLARRSEVKYPLFRVDLDAIRRVLELQCCRLQHGLPRPTNPTTSKASTVGCTTENPSTIYRSRERVSTVRSIYFDDPQLSSGLANVDGLGRRSKLRLRWYDSPLPQQHAYLEIKWRENRITGKHRLHLECSQSMHELPFAEMIRGIHRVAPLLFQRMLDRYFDPTLLVEYAREHFSSTDGTIRLTLDHSLKFYDQTGKKRPSVRFGRTLPSFAVLEGKSSPCDIGELRGLLGPLALRAGRCSKYVHGLTTVGLLARSIC